MTHDAPGEADVRWCPHCELTVEPTETASGRACPACGREI